MSKAWLGKRVLAAVEDMELLMGEAGHRPGDWSTNKVSGKFSTRCKRCKKEFYVSTNRKTGEPTILMCSALLEGCPGTNVDIPPES